MPGRARSDLDKAQKCLRDNHSKLEAAVKAYREEQELPTGRNGRPRGYAQIAKDFGVGTETLRCREKGIRMDRWEEVQQRSLLGPEAEEQMVRMIEGRSDRAEPPTNKQMQEMAEHLYEVQVTNEARNAAARGEPFSGPETFRIGRNWVRGFKSRHSDRLETCWAHNLDSHRADALRRDRVDQFFTTVRNRYEQENVQNCDIYAIDETPMMDAQTCSLRVTCRAGEKHQHIRQDGNRETTTVVATICADGSYLPPFVIFQGEYLQEDWMVENPGDAA